MTRRRSRLESLAPLVCLFCACTNRAARTDAGSIAQSPRPDDSGGARTSSAQPTPSAAQPAAEAQPDGGTHEPPSPAPVGVQSESTCGGASIRQTIAHRLWANPVFSGAVCAEPCTESELTEHLVYYDVVLREEPRVEGCHVFDQTATHIVSALFAINGTDVRELIIYQGYSLGSDPTHRSHGYKDLIGLQNEGFSEGFVHWVEERFVWDGRRYNLKQSRRLKDGEMK